MPKPIASSIEAYIEAAPEVGRPHLRELYRILKSVAPHATEAIKWGNPFFIEPRFLFAFSAFKNHCSFSPTQAAMAAFRPQMDPKLATKVLLKLPYNQPLPKDLIRAIAECCVDEVRHRTTDSFW